MDGSRQGQANVGGGQLKLASSYRSVQKQDKWPCTAGCANDRNSIFHCRVSGVFHDYFKVQIMAERTITGKSASDLSSHGFTVNVFV